MELIVPNKRFVCVDYPGDVIDIDNAVKTLGGLKALHKTFKDKNVRLKLNFRSNDQYCKPAYGDLISRASLVIKVRRKKVNDANLNQETSESIQGEIIGVTNTAYNFTALCDFQYLAVKKNEDGTYESHIDESIVKEVQPKDWLSQPAHLFILPPIFSRFDQPIRYCFRETASHKHIQFPDNCIGMSRSRRPHFTIFLKFNNPNIPFQPHEDCIKKLKKLGMSSWKVDQIKEKFEQRNIWSTVALLAEVGPAITREDLKVILPSVAYHCADGPWRAMWIKLGYDMRKDPSSKIYQSLDARQEKRMSMPLANKIPAKRSTFNYHLPNTFVRNPGFQGVSIQQSPFKEKDDKKLDYKTSLEPSYIFRPGIIPSHRQIFYHLFNIYEEEVNKLIHMNDGKEKECTEKDGWCLPDTIEKCRTIINSYRYKYASEAPDSQAEQMCEDDDQEEEDYERNYSGDEEVMNMTEFDECDEEEGEISEYEPFDVLDQDKFENILNMIDDDDD